MKKYNLPFIVGLMLIHCWVSAFSQSPEQALQTLFSSSAIDKDRTAVYIWDLEAEYPVVSKNADIPVIPASVMKCVTTAALSTALPYKSSIETPVYLLGEQKDRIFTGNLVVEGRGDPSLNDNRHQGQTSIIKEIRDALNNLGIEEINGAVVIDNSLFAGSACHPSWSEDDKNQSYGTGCHAFNFEGNASGKKAIANPSAVFKKKLIASLNDEGIAFNETELNPKRNRTDLLTHSSPLLSELMRSCMFRSDNLYAESFLRLFGVCNGTDGSIASSSRVEMQHWDALNFPLENVEISDGSGLSRQNLLTAEFLAMVLRYCKNDPEYVSFFPLVGEEGTVKNFMKDTRLQGYLALKTGSMTGIQSYAGYLLDEDFNPTHVVVVMSNGLKNREAFKKDLSNFFLSVF